jgi:hypothetical protein
MKKRQVTKFKTKNRDGITYMICRNSITDDLYWGHQLLDKHPRCNNWIPVGISVTAVLCSKCVSKTTSPPEINKGYISSGKLRGWQFMKEFVDQQGNVFFKGVEQPKLKGTLKATEPPPEKKKLSKLEKSTLREKILEQIVSVKRNIKAAKFKKDINAGNVQMRKLTKQLKLL